MSLGDLYFLGYYLFIFSLFIYARFQYYYGILFYDTVFTCFYMITLSLCFSRYKY
jgi:hypothetical protein